MYEEILKQIERTEKTIKDKGIDCQVILEVDAGIINLFIRLKKSWYEVKTPLSYYMVDKRFFDITLAKIAGDLRRFNWIIGDIIGLLTL